MRQTAVRDSAAAVGLDRLGLLLPVLGLGVVAASSVVVGPERLTGAVLGALAITFVAVRPQWGVAFILTTLMVQYGSRRYEREGWAALANLVPQGEGLVTANNMLGVFLVLLLVYEVYRDSDWSFLKSRQVQFVGLVTAALVFSSLVSGVDLSERAEIGLAASSEQAPTRVLISRALFLVLFLSFIRRPKDLRMITALFIALTLATAWSGSSAALMGAGRREVAEYRAGGLEVLLQTAQNPNRLALLSTLGLIFIWEYSQSRRRWGVVAIGAALLLVVTVFLTASRGGVVGLFMAGLLLLMRRRGGASRWLSAAAVVLVGAVLIQQIVPEEALERLRNIPGLVDTSRAVGEGSVQRREYTYGVALRIWQTAPLVGVGAGNWPYVRFMTDPTRSAAAPHNSYLKALAEGGVVALGLYLLLFYVTIRELLRLERRPDVMARAAADGLDWELTATRVSLMAFLVFSLFADLWDLVYCYLLLGMAAVLIKRYGGTRPPVSAYA